MQSEPSSGITLTAYSCICWLFHRIYFTQLVENLKVLHKKSHSGYKGMFFFNQFDFLKRKKASSITVLVVCPVERVKQLNVFTKLSRGVSLLESTPLTQFLFPRMTDE